MVKAERYDGASQNKGAYFYCNTPVCTVETRNSIFAQQILAKLTDGTVHNRCTIVSGETASWQPLDRKAMFSSKKAEIERERNTWGKFNTVRQGKTKKSQLVFVNTLPHQPWFKAKFTSKHDDETTCHKTSLAGRHTPRGGRFFSWSFFVRAS